MATLNDAPETGDQAAEKLIPRLDGLISDERLRGRVRRIIDERPPEPAWERLSKHPVVTLVLGFMLTWGVGTLLTKSWEQAQLETQRALEQQRRAVETRITVIDDFFALSEEHSARAFLVQQALDRSAPTSEIGTLIHAKSEVFVKTMARFGSLRYKLRPLLRPELYERVVKAWDRGVFVPLQIIDQAQAAAFEDRLQRRRSPRLSAFDRQQADEASGTVASCTQALAEALWYSAIVAAEDASPEQRDRSLGEMDEKCKSQF